MPETGAVPRISVVITTYNRGGLLRRCLDSVLAQRLENFEVVVVDDASSDETPSIMATYTDPRIQYLRLERNAGAPAKPRNRGISRTRAELVFVFDSDDTMLPHCLGHFVELFERAPDVGIAWSWKNVLDASGHVQRIERRDRLANEPLLPLAIGYAPGANGLAIRRSVLNELVGFDEALPRMDDYEFFLRFARSGRWRAFVIAEITMNVHADAGDHISVSPARTLSAREHILRKHADLFSEHPQHRAAWHFQVAQLRLSVRRDRIGFLAALAHCWVAEPRRVRRLLAIWRVLSVPATTATGAKNQV